MINFFSTVLYKNSEGTDKRVFLNGKNDTEWTIKGEVIQATLLLYGSSYRKIELYRGNRLLWSKESPKGEVLKYNKDVI